MAALAHAAVVPQNNLAGCPATGRPENLTALETKMRGKLLMIDDQASITKVVGLVASRIGLDVKIVNDPYQALDAFVAYQPDIMILDMIMPEKDGVDVLNEILLTGIPTRIILTSGFSESYLRLAEGVARFHDTNTIHVLRKPFRRDELIAKLEELLPPDQIGC
jgi:two-component system response regulator MtrA